MIRIISILIHTLVTSFEDFVKKHSPMHFYVQKILQLQVILCNLTAFIMVNKATTTSAKTASHIVAKPPAPKINTITLTPKAKNDVLPNDFSRRTTNFNGSNYF